MSKSKKIRRKVRYSIVYRLVRFFIYISSIIPRISWLKFCGLLGRAAYYFAGKTRKRVIAHLTLAFGKEKTGEEIKKLARKVFEMLGKNAGDMLRAMSVETLSDLQEFVSTTGFENCAKALEKGKGIIFLACHVGAFDLQVTYMALRGLQPNIVGTPLKDPRLNDLLFDYRNKYGAKAVERGKDTFRLIKVLLSKGTVALLIDQDTKVKSRFVNFFGRPAATPVGAAILAMKTGAVVIPTVIYLGDDWKQHMHIFPELPLQLTGDEETDMIANTQAYTAFNEALIRSHPEQWVWMHERWKTKPGEEVR